MQDRAGHAHIDEVVRQSTSPAPKRVANRHHSQGAGSHDLVSAGPVPRLSTAFTLALGMPAETGSPCPRKIGDRR